MNSAWPVVGEPGVPVAWWRAAAPPRRSGMARKGSCGDRSIRSVDQLGMRSPRGGQGARPISAPAARSACTVSARPIRSRRSPARAVHDRPGSALSAGHPGRHERVAVPVRRRSSCRAARRRAPRAAGPDALPGSTDRATGTGREWPEQRFVKDGHGRADLVQRAHRLQPQRGGPPQQVDLLAQPAPGLAVLAGAEPCVVQVASSPPIRRSASVTARRLASVGCAVSTGCTRRPASSALSAAGASSARSTSRAAATDSLGGRWPVSRSRRVRTRWYSSARLAR